MAALGVAVVKAAVTAVVNLRLKSDNLRRCIGNNRFPIRFFAIRRLFILFIL